MQEAVGGANRKRTGGRVMQPPEWDYQLNL